MIGITVPAVFRNLYNAFFSFFQYSLLVISCFPVLLISHGGKQFSRCCMYLFYLIVTTGQLANIKVSSMVEIAILWACDWKSDNWTSGRIGMKHF